MGSQFGPSCDTAGSGRGGEEISAHHVSRGSGQPERHSQVMGMAPGLRDPAPTPRPLSPSHPTHAAPTPLRGGTRSHLNTSTSPSLISGEETGTGFNQSCLYNEASRKPPKRMRFRELPSWETYRGVGEGPQREHGRSDLLPTSLGLCITSI